MANDAARPAGWKVDAALLAIALVWGATFVLVKQALADVSTLLFLTVRFSIASVALAFIFRNEFRAKQVRLSLVGGCIAGVFLFGGYVLQTTGLKFTTASNAGFLTGLNVPLVPIIGAMVYRKLPQLSELLGVGIAVVGMFLLAVRGDILAISRGDLLVGGCAIAFAFQIVVVGRFAPASNAGVLTVAQITTGAVLGAATFWWLEPVRIVWSPGVWLALAVTSVLATALAFLVQAWAQRWTSPTRTALIFAMEPVFAWMTSYLLTGEMLSRRGAMGAVLILAGILTAELKPFRRAGTTG